MKRKILSLCLAAVIALGSLAGCGSGGDTGNDAAKASATDTAEKGTENNKGTEADKPSDEIVEVIWQFPMQSEVGEAFYRMEDALNEMMERDIGVHVTFEPTGLQESQKDATLMVSAGEQLDICLTAFTSVGNLVDSGLILPLDDLLEEYGQDIISHTENLLGSCMYDNQIYGVTTGNANYNIKAYLMKKRFAEKYDCLPDDNKIYTLEEIEAIFDEIKAAEGDDFLCNVPWNNTYEPLNYCLGWYDKIGGDLSWGALMLEQDHTDTTIYNLFDTDEYAEYCDMMYRWAQKGYISPDAAVTSDGPMDIIVRENVAGMFAGGVPKSEMMGASSWGEEEVHFKVIDAFIAGGTTAIMWNIPITSANPGKAVEALNYIYKNKEAAWLIQFGFEGEEWEVVERDGDNVLVKYCSDIPGDLPYVNPYGIWGDRLEWPVFDPSPINISQMQREFQDSIPDSRKSPAIGYSFKSESVSSEIAAISTVIAQYAPSLNCGAIDPSKALPEFIDALNAAGIKKVIAENQRQFDEWLALQ